MSVLKSPLHMHHPTNIKKEETPQVLPRSQASQVSATRSLYFILLNFMRLVKQFLQFSIVYADVIYHIPLFCNGNGFSVSIPTTGTGLRSLFRPYIHLLYFNNEKNLLNSFMKSYGVVLYKFFLIFIMENNKAKITFRFSQNKKLLMSIYRKWQMLFLIQSLYPYGCSNTIFCSETI